MLWITILPDINKFCHMVSEELCSQSAMERQTDGRKTKIYEKYTGYQPIKIQDTYLRYNYITNVLACPGLWPILAVYPHYVLQYDLWWSHYWSCNIYVLTTLTPSKNKMAPFIAWISKKHDFSCSDRDQGSVQVISKETLKLVFDGSSINVQH